MCVCGKIVRVFDLVACVGTVIDQWKTRKEGGRERGREEGGTVNLLLVVAAVCRVELVVVLCFSLVMLFRGSYGQETMVKKS